MNILLTCQHCAWPDVERTEVLAAVKLSNTHILIHNVPGAPILSHTGAMI